MSEPMTPADRRDARERDPRDQLTQTQIDETRDLAAIDFVSGHITAFWKTRINALCEALRVRVASPTAPDLRDALDHALKWIEASEWEGCDPSAMPVCSGCGRDRPDTDVTEWVEDENHNADCTWLAIVRELRAVLQERPTGAPKEPGHAD